MSTYKNLMTVCCAAVLALGLAACGSSSDNQTTDDMDTGPTGTPVMLANLQSGMIVPAGTYEISGDAAALMAILDDLGALTVPADGYAPGAMVTAGGLTLMCSNNSATNCNLTINDNGTVTTMGTILVAMTGTMLPDDRTDDQKRADTESDVNEAFAAAVTYKGDAETAKGNADTALMTATEKSGELDAVTVQGDSGLAMRNAQMVLDQRDAVDTAETDAMTADTNLMTARNTAVGDPDTMGDTGNVPEDHPQRAELITALNSALDDVGDYVDDIGDIIDGAASEEGTLANALAKVEKAEAYGYKAATDDDAEVLGTPRGVAESVAMDVAMLLVPTNETPGSLDGNAAVVDDIANGGTDGATDDPILDADGRINFVNGPVPLRDNDPTTEDDPASAHSANSDKHANGRVSMNWAQLAAHLGLEPIWVQLALTGTIGADQQTVSARGVLVDGAVSTVAEIATAAGTSDSPGTGIDDRAVFTGATWKGLPGLFVCVGGPCGLADADADGNRKLASDMETIGTSVRTGHWYFVPQSQNTSIEVVGTFHPSSSRVRSFVATGTDTYAIDLQYAVYGYWLDISDNGTADNADDDFLRMRRYAIAPGNTASLDWTDDAETTGVDTATYEGPAIGMSVLKGIKADGTFGPVASGHFDANVSLTATFAGAASTVGGTIDNFRGDAVNSGWLVTLTPQTITEATSTLTAAGQAEGSGPAGVGHAGGVGQNGVWTAQAYGPAPVTVDGSPVNQRPEGITGTFDAHFADGHAAGVYATRKQ